MAERHLLLVSDTLQAGGAERVMASLANFLARRQQVTLLTLFPAEDHYSLEPSVRRIRFQLPGVPRWRNRDWGQLALARQGWALGAVFGQLKPQVALTFMETANILGLVAGLRSRVPVVISERCDPSQLGMNRWDKRVYRWFLYRMAAGFVAQSERAAGWARAFLPARKIHILPNLLPFAGLPPRAGGESQAHVLLSVGRLVESKGPMDLVEAFATIGANFPEWRLRLLGEGPLESCLRERIARPDLLGRVELAGCCRDVAAEYRAATAFAHASWAEGFPNALWEALWQGLPCVVTDSFASRPGLLRDGRQALVVPVGDRPALAGALARLLGSPALRAELAREGQRAAEPFGFDRCGPLWEELLLSLAG